VTPPPHPPPSVREGKFAGPLDLLLAEVRRQRVAIEEVDLAPVVGRFLDYLRTAKAANMNLDIEWLHLAATLVHWKSRALLPVAPEGREAPGDPVRDELVGGFFSLQITSLRQTVYICCNDDRLLH
jgi:chromatin segregation and condensation protein Rec8/ScpA/Scc1 (kleisin family)